MTEPSRYRNGRIYTFHCTTCGFEWDLWLLGRPPERPECPQCRSEAVRTK